MPPARTNSSDIQEGKHKRKPAHSEGEVGTQKIKSALRQTRRLLAKDNLDAGVRITTERRLATLEQQLASAETSRKEKNFATNYHMVKFFDKKKAMRRIEQLKKQLNQGDVDPEELEAELFEKRVELNYIIHYPPLEKYIALHPSEKAGGSSKGKAKASESSKETDTKRDEMKSRIREAMRTGQMSGEPETNSHNAREIPPRRINGTQEADPPSVSGKKKKGKHKEGEVERIKPTKPTVENDDFFGTD